MTDTRNLLRILWQRRIAFLSGFVATCAAAALVTFALPKSYSTATYLWVKPKGSAASGYEATQVSQVLTRSYAELLQGRGVANQVAEVLPGRPKPQEIERVVEIRPIEESQLLEIRAERPTPRRAKELADTYARVFLARSGASALAGGSELTVAEPAPLPIEPSKPQPTVYLLVGVVLAVFAGTGLALLRDLLDQRLDVDASTTELLGLQVIGRLPETGGSVLSRSRTGAERRAGVDEAFRLLLANITFVTLGHMPRSLAVVSAESGEGKSACCLNLGRVATESGTNVLLVDADLRRPTLARSLEVDGSTRGLSTLLVEPISIPKLFEHGAHLVVVEPPSLDAKLIPAGPIPPNPSALLGSPRFEQLERAVRNDFELTLYDTPRVSGAADALLVAARAEAVILIVDVTKTGRTAAKRAVDELQRANANILGVVLNRLGRVADYYYEGQGLSAPSAEEHENGGAPSPRSPSSLPRSRQS